MQGGVPHLVLLITSVIISATSAINPSDVRAALQAIATKKAAQYNCSVSVAVKNADFSVAAADGTIDFASGRQASTLDGYAWGSGTKPLTGASVLKLIADGHFALEDGAAKLIDPIISFHKSQDPSIQFSSMGELWGSSNISHVTIEHLLNMTSGIPDFDTAKGRGTVATDALRAELYKNPTKAYSPFELMSAPWVKGQYRKCEDPRPGPDPRYHKCYSSTNFMLLGLLLANRTGWSAFQQSSFLPPSLKGQLRFGVTGAPRDYSPVHGYDRTIYNQPAGQHNDQDVAGVDGVFAGWTASDLVGNASAVAALAWEIYGPSPTILPKAWAQKMVEGLTSEKHAKDYGLATFNLARVTGQTGDFGTAYGHLGATYGFQSQMLYFPRLQFSLAVTTNLETDRQTQPKDVVCFAYNAVAGLLLQKQIQCNFTESSYYGSGCKCTPAAAEA